MKERKLIVCSGPSGVGKSSVLKKVMQEIPDSFFSVSATTRAPRPGETPGVSYHYMDKQEFERMLAENALLEYNQYAGEYYGTPAKPIEQALEENRTVFLDVDPNGAFAVRRNRPDAALVYIAAPSMQEVRRRLESRGDTPPDKMEARLKQAQWENRQASSYDYIVMNDNLDECAKELLAIIAGSENAENYTAEKRISIFKEEM